jgi:prepilin-type N-terminal cleavage/methylation domain-containing protein
MNRNAGTKATRALSTTCGFTLMELMIVILIAAVLLAIAVPNTINWMRQRSARDAADQLSMDLQRAKLLAIQRNANCEIRINTPGPNQYTISVINEVVDLGTYTGAVVFTDAPDVSAPFITFTPQGVCQNFGAFYLTSQNRRYRVRATAAGGISVHLSSGGQWI